MSRRKQKSARTSARSVSHDVFSEVELDFFKRGDDLHRSTEEHAPAGDTKPDAEN